MKIVVTCGPSYAPIDQARRITNFSTGRLGIALANALAAEGWEVICFKGAQATCADPLSVHAVQTFSTNQDLAAQLEALSASENIHAIFHAAALCDFEVERVLNEHGDEVASPKLSTREGRLTLMLTPAIKVLPKLRGWFRNGHIVGWKYELAGTPEDAFEKAWRQIRETQSDACVLNGAAYGAGFALCTSDRKFRQFADNLTLIQGLARWLKNA